MDTKLIENKLVEMEERLTSKMREADEQCEKYKTKLARDFAGDLLSLVKSLTDDEFERFIVEAQSNQKISLKMYTSLVILKVGIEVGDIQ
nr:MAG TPA: hypothetical protein [Caudoviricetes sp.]